MPFGEYIIATHSWSEDQTAIEKGFPELIRCQDCTFYNDNANTCGNPLGMIKPARGDYCSQRKKRKEE